MIAGKGGNQLDAIQMDFTARRFDTFSEVFTIEYYDSDGILQEVDLTGATAQMQLKKRKSDAIPFFNMDVAISGNELTLSKNHLMMDIPAGKYWYDIEVKDASSNHITWVQGRFVVVEHITEFVDTILTYLSATFNSVISIFNVPKIVLVTYWKAALSFIPSPAYWIRTTFNAIPGFTSLGFITEKYINKFISTIGIYTIPKTIFATIFRVVVSVTTNVYYYGTSRWSTRLGFQTSYTT